VLHELRVENLLLLDRAELRLAPGLNVLTGETGAGKTLLAQALDLLLGGRARAGVVRAGAGEAYVEGVFAFPPGLERPEIVPRDAEELVLARRVWPDGRTRAYVCGRSSSAADLRELGGRVLAFYGQHEHRKLMLSAAQLDLVDAHCGPRQSELRNQMAAAHERLRQLQARLEKLGQLAGSRDRELDLLAFELREIEAAGLSEDEKEALLAKRERLRHLEALRGAAAAGAAALCGEDEGGVAELLARAAQQLEPAGSIDPVLAPLVGRVDALRYEAEELGRELRGYVGALAGEPMGSEAEEPLQLDEIEERLTLLARLERKHGGTIGEVLAYAVRCRERIQELEQAEVALEATQRDLAEATAAAEAIAGRLSQSRRRAAGKLVSAVRDRLSELAMPEATFEIEVHRRPQGLGPRGYDAVEFTISANPGLTPAPLKDVASGGELSRVMLALLSAAHGGTPESPPGGTRKAIAAQTADLAATGPLLVFDEIDAGIGGHTARAVGQHLRGLAVGRQILCITHLPQVAAGADRHFTIVKDATRTPATTSVAELDGDGVVSELVRMMGAGEDDHAASQHARALLRLAA
jgi:DNA repair protein RecN (Recombination protein N)